MQAIHNEVGADDAAGVCCFKEQRYKINASNSQQLFDKCCLALVLFQRAKIQDKCKQFTTGFTVNISTCTLFQRAKIQDKCKQFTTVGLVACPLRALFQRAKIQDKCMQFTTSNAKPWIDILLFQRAKIQDKCKQFTTLSFSRYFWLASDLA